MMEKKELDPIELFIDKLASRAFYSYAGEKPLVILAAIETSSGIMRENQLALSEVLSSPILSQQIKRAFINLARKTGKLKDPESSWGNVITTNEELITVLKEKKSVDEAFRTLTEERADKIIRKCYTKLGL